MTYEIGHDAGLIPENYLRLEGAFDHEYD